jgi:alginate O-acetyltransferase complex protein AlgJ
MSDQSPQNHYLVDSNDPSNDELPPSPKPRQHTLADRLSAPLVGAALLLFMATGLWSSVESVLDGTLAFKAENLTLASFLDGKLTSELNANLAKTPLPELFASWEQRAMWRISGDSGNNVRTGCKDWLFLADELKLFPRREQNADARAQDVISVHNALKKRNIILVVAVVPDKTRIEAAHLCGLNRSTLFEERVHKWLAQLTAAGIVVVDLQPALKAVVNSGQQAYWRTDSHWNEAGAAAGAAVIAQKIISLSLALTPHQDFNVTRKAATQHQGDLVHLAGLDKLAPELQPRTEFWEESQFIPIEKPDSPKSPQDRTDKDRSNHAQRPNTVLIGTSFSEMSNFVSFLEHDLHVRIDNFAINGGGFSKAPQAYFASDTFKNTPPRLIVWEVPERVLEDNWKNAEMMVGGLM